jgi:hypothetical protein
MKKAEWELDRPALIAWLRKFETLELERAADDEDDADYHAGKAAMAKLCAVVLEEGCFDVEESL